MDQSNTSNPSQSFPQGTTPAAPPMPQSPIQQQFSSQQQPASQDQFAQAPQQQATQDPFTPPAQQIPPMQSPEMNQPQYPTMPQTPAAQPIAPPPFDTSGVSNPIMPTDPTQTISASTEVSMQPSEPKAGSKKKLLFLILGILSLIIIGGITYLFVFNKKPAEPVSVTIPSPTQTPEEQPLVQREVGETPEEQEVIDIEEASFEEDFQSIDQDLQSL